MKEITISEETYRQLLALKNYWSFSYRNVTNQEIIDKLEACKKEIFGYESEPTLEEIESASKGKTRKKLEEESERFQRALKILLESEVDVEPEYTMDEHLRKMRELIDNSEDVGTPLF